MSIFEPYINQINSVVPDIGKTPPSETHEFFGYLLISQMETVESVSQLENRVFYFH